MRVAVVPRMCVRWEVKHKRLPKVASARMKLPRSLYLAPRRAPLVCGFRIDAPTERLMQ
jgi:hypothetical protein